MYENILKERNDCRHWAGILGIDMTFKDRDHGTARMRLKDDYYNPVNAVHGGMVYTVADVAASVLLRTDGAFYVTAQSDFHFLSASVKGDGATELLADAEVIKRGNKLIVTNVIVRDNLSRLIASGTFTHCHI